VFVSGKLKNRINDMAVRSKGIYDAHLAKENIPYSLVNSVIN
jgi:hypothetical protein